MQKGSVGINRKLGAYIIAASAAALAAGAAFLAVDMRKDYRDAPKVVEMPPISHLPPQALYLMTPTDTQGRYLRDGIAADFDGDGDPDLALVFSDDYSHNLEIKTAAGKTASASSFNPKVAGPAEPFVSATVADNNGNGKPEIYLVSGSDDPNVPESAGRFLRVYELDGGKLRAFTFPYETEEGTVQVDFLENPRVVGDSVFVVEGRKGKDLVLQPYAFNGTLLVPSGDTVTYTEGAQRAEWRIAAAAASATSSEALSGKIDEILAGVGEPYRKMLGPSALPVEAQVGIAFVDSFVGHLYAEAGYSTLGQIQRDENGTPFVTDSSGNKAAPRIPPIYTFSHGEQRVWRDSETGFFYTVDNDGKPMDRFRIARDGNVVYSGPAQTSFASDHTLPGDPVPWTGKEHWTVIGERREGDETTTMRVCGAPNDPAVLSAQSALRQQEDVRAFHQNFGRAQEDVQRGLNAAGSAANTAAQEVGRSIGSLLNPPDQN